MNTDGNMSKISEYNLNRIFGEAKDKYIVPLYQREYAWGKTEIERLLNDLFLAFQKGGDLNYYLGSFVVRESGGGAFELVDGQQRLITLSMLFALFLKGENTAAEKVLSFQLRKDADEFMDRCYQDRGGINFGYGKEESAFGTAASIIKNFYPETLDERKLLNGRTGAVLDEVLELRSEKNGCSFRDYLLNRVILFRVELPVTTNVNAYFEIMNNRGEQLKYHEILKAKLLAKLEMKCTGSPEIGSYDELAPKFDDIWTACSRMNGYIGHHLHRCSEYDKEDAGSWTDTAKWDKYLRPLSEEDDNVAGNVEQSVIWDFSNFLMHALKCYQKTCIPNSRVIVTLDERDMEAKYGALDENIDPVLFLDLLIRLRLKFDKFVVKAVNDENGDVESWQLAYVKKNKKSYDTVNSFDGEIQSRLVCFESMLQVSFNTQRNKDWLQYLLELDEATLSDGEKLLSALKSWSRDRLAKFKAEKETEGKDFYRLGLECSRHLLNLADYLMWEFGVNAPAQAEFKTPDEFVFRYFNSVEHHHPQRDDQANEVWKPEDIDDIGNLFLVYSSENSSMSNREPNEKKRRYVNAHDGNLPENPKRRWMYEHTDEAGWKLDDMRKLSKHVRGLMDGFLES